MNNRNKWSILLKDGTEKVHQADEVATSESGCLILYNTNKSDYNPYPYITGGTIQTYSYTFPKAATNILLILAPGEWRGIRRIES